MFFCSYTSLVEAGQYTRPQNIAKHHGPKISVSFHTCRIAIVNS